MELKYVHLCNLCQHKAFFRSVTDEIQRQYCKVKYEKDGHPFHLHKTNTKGTMVENCDDFQ
jgi:hypothetical protein